MYSILDIDVNHENLSITILNSVILTHVYYACCILIVKIEDIEKYKKKKKNLPRMLKK